MATRTSKLPPTMVPFANIDKDKRTGKETLEIQANWLEWFQNVNTTDNKGNNIDYRADANQGYTYVIPTTGFSVTIPDGCSDYIMNAAGVLATGTLTMPAGPIDGQRLCVCSTKAITALTMNANTGQTLDGGLTSMAANSFAEWRYLAVPALWVRIG